MLHLDWLWSVVSILIAAVCNLPVVLRQVWPYITTLISFIGFVAWNGGVVLGTNTHVPHMLSVATNTTLGDKSNHVATIHLAQMLYIWPLFSFFSLPLLTPYALPLLSGLSRLVLSPQPASSKSERPSSQPTNKIAASAKPTPQSLSNRPDSSAPLSRFTASFFDQTTIWLSYILSTLALSVLVVRYNTIIHPFTLADNRHYMFYVFRYSIRRSQVVRFALVLPYTLSRWLVWGTLSGCSDWAFGETGPDCSMHYQNLSASPFVSHPLRIVAGPEDVRQTDSPYQPVLGDETKQSDRPQQNPMYADPLACSTEPISTSTAIVFLLTTTLSLVTAPLVEPRYFIIPWVMWRLLIPAWRLHDHGGLIRRVRLTDFNGRLDTLLGFFRRYDLRLVLETVWFVVINLATMYIFLTKPYQWRAEDGTLLDEGRWQRFMW